MILHVDTYIKKYQDIFIYFFILYEKLEKFEFLNFFEFNNLTKNYTLIRNFPKIFEFFIYNIFFFLI